MPKIAALVNDTSSIVRIQLADCIAALATEAKRFLQIAETTASTDSQSQEPDSNVSGEVSTAVQPFKYVIGLCYYFQFDSHQESSSLKDTVQDIVVTLLCDQNNAVKMRLVGSGLSKLAAFFGRNRASDVLLSHMITFLNDKVHIS